VDPDKSRTERELRYPPQRAVPDRYPFGKAILRGDSKILFLGLSQQQAALVPASAGLYFQGQFAGNPAIFGLIGFASGLIPDRALQRIPSCLPTPLFLPLLANLRGAHPFADFLEVGQCTLAVLEVF